MAIVVGSSLPPQVEGQLRCYLVVKVDVLKWCIPRPPKDVQVKILWWGDTSNCVLLRPIVENGNGLDNTHKCVEAHYPVRCGPKQFNAYLADMKSLLFDVVYGRTCADFAKIEVPNIHQVTASKPIFGHYPLICSTVNLKRKQVGTLSITIAFKSISDTFNMASSIIPTTDEQFEGMPLKQPKKFHSKSWNSKSKETISKTDFSSVNNSKHINKKTELEDQQQVNYETPKEVVNHSPAKIINSSPGKIVSTCMYSDATLNKEESDNVLTTLLVKGQHLRDAMLKSSINSKLIRCNETDGFKDHNNVEIQKIPNQNLVEIMERKTIDLVLGNEDEILLEQLSDHSVIESEEGDPLHDSSLLSDLFYTKKKENKLDESSVILSEDSGEETSIHSLKKQSKYFENEDKDLLCEDNNDNGSVDSSDNNSNILLESNKIYLKEPKNNFSKENLSIDQITNLSKVKFAKVHVRELHLYQFYENSIYYVEFKFPVHKSIEVVRLVSRSKDGNCVKFDRCLELPVSFNEETINYWLNCHISLNLFAKYGNNKPDFFGNGSLSLKDVAINQNLATEFMIDMFDKHANSHKDKYVSIGNLQIVIELLPNVNNSSNYLQKPEKNLIRNDECSKSLRMHHECSKSLRIHHEKDKILLGKLDNELQNLIAIYEGSVNFNECFHWNLYCVCRVFWVDYEMKTKVIWGSCSPKFNFEQIVSIKTKSFHKTENNYLIIELWNKPLNQGKDKLLGICKVPLQTLFTVFKNCDLADIFLKSQCPVILCDSHMPVFDLITGKESGNLKLLIAVGLPKQISYLLHMHVSHLQMKGIDRKVDVTQLSSSVLHEIEIAVEKLNIVFSDGRDAECYIKYNFPKQLFGDFKMSYFQTKPRLLMSNPQTDRHVFSLPFNIQLQQCLLQCMNTHRSTDIIFEIWKQSCDVQKSDLLVGKGTLGVSKIFSLFYASSGSPSMQQLSIPILHDKNLCKGSLELSIKYTLHQENLATVTNTIETETIFLSASVMRLCGLKDAVNEVFRHHKYHDQYLENGVRTYVRCHLSFLSETSFVESCVVAASHSPTFNFQYEVPLKVNNESDLLIEISNGYLICQVLTNEGKPSETILGKAKIPLKQLLTHNTGVKGWYLFKLCNEEKTVTGGVELNIRFLNPFDRDNLINYGMGRGWIPKFIVQHHDESWLLSTDKRLCFFIISINLLFLPMQVIDNFLTERSFIYTRYKFYDQGAIQSRFSGYRRFNESFLSEINHMHQFQLIPTPTLAWYLREESLEIEFWLNNSRLENNENSDILIGSSYICLEQFSHDPYSVDTISGCYPLFRAGSKCICRSNCNITVHFNEDKSNYFRRTGTQTVNIFSDLFSDQFSAQVPVFLNDNKEMSESITPKNLDAPTISIRIEEALHLPKVNHNKDIVSFIYVSYTISDRCVFTNVIPNNKNPVWNFQKDECFDLRSLKNHEFSFTVWRSLNKDPNSEIDILLGTVYVDVSPLFSGMRELLGWYNVKDCNRQNNGQIKIGIVPYVLLSPSHSAKFFKSFNTAVSFDLTSSKKDSYYDSNLSKLELLDKLHTNLQELDCITKTIRDSSLVSYVSPVCKPQFSENTKTENSCIINGKHITKTKLIEPLRSLDVNLDRQKIKNDGIFNKEEQKVDAEKLSSDEQKVEELSSDDDTDELMNHLEEFKKKYNRLKEFSNLEFEQDWLSDDDQSVLPLEYKEDIPFVETENDVINVSAKTSARDIDEQDENSSDLIQNAYLFHSMEKKCPKGLNKCCNPNDILCDDDQVDALNNRKTSNKSIDQSICMTDSSVSEKGRHEFSDLHLLENNIPESHTKDGLTEIKKKHFEIPNFFMKSNEMAESIKALRLAAKFSHLPRSKNKDVNETSGIEVINKYSPVDTLELARRAQIFLSKNNQT
ncbi:C2 domain-containing protein 3 isoform X1 [Hydra vulgaris]|uniref:C2 domain-containing protein 3 isoform X1 n=2 Tax=Hydra vulgaris TaxID=6087 RepID=UPI001F5FC95A|nr:C2 domain-containing protein 3 [Hydra vulgaris]